MRDDEPRPVWMSPLISSSYWTVYKFFASQSQHKYKIIIFFSGEANDEANFSFFVLLHKRSKHIHSLISILPPTYPPIPPPPSLCDAVGGAFYYL